MQVLAVGIWMARILANMPTPDLNLLERLASRQPGTNLGEVQLSQ